MRRLVAACAGALLLCAGLASPAESAVPIAAPAPTPVNQGGADMPGPETYDPPPPFLKRVKAWEDAAAARDAKGVDPKLYAPKGLTGKKSDRIDPRFRKSGAVSASLLTGPYYIYGTVGKTTNAPEGVMADMTIADPYINTASDFHTLMQIAVIKANGDGTRNTVELGTTIDNSFCARGVGGTDDPCVFGFHQESDTGGCYNACGWVDSPTGNYDLGDRIPNVNDSSGDKFKVRETSDAWWLSFGSTSDPDSYMGYFPKSLWTGATGVDGADNGGFDQMTSWQMFTEIATNEVPNASFTGSPPTPCTDAGNGYVPSGAGGGTQAARIVNIQTIDDPGSVVADTAPTIFSGGGSHNDNPTAQAVIAMNSTAPINDFRVGGSEWRGNNTLPGFRDGCG